MNNESVLNICDGNSCEVCNPQCRLIQETNRIGEELERDEE